MDQGEVIDNVFIALKWNGFYQVSRTAILLLSLVNNAFTAASVVFIGKAVNFNCRRLKSLSIKNVTYDLSLSNSNVPFLINYTECSVDVRNGSDLIFTSNCSDGYEYADSTTSSFVAEWDLVCDKESYSDISQGVVVLGEMFGCLSLTRFADRCGRKVTYIITSVMYFAANMLAAFSISFAYFLLFRFITGVFDACCQQLSYIMLIEMMPTTHRALPQKLSSFIWPISLMFLCLVAYLTRDLSWHFTHICLSMFAVHSIFLWWITDESIRWLCAVKRYKDVEKLIMKISRINHVDPADALEILRANGLSPYSIKLAQKTDSIAEVLISQAMLDTKSSNPDTRVSVFVKNKNLFKITAVAGYTWFTDSLSYHGLLFISPNLNEDFYLGFLLGVIIEIPATILFCLLIDRIGRKKCIMVFHVSGGIFILLSTFTLYSSIDDGLPGQYGIFLVLALLGRLSVTASFSAVLTFVPELFPTSVRNTGLGFSAASLYLGSTIAPHARTVSRHAPWAPNLVFGVLCLTVSMVIHFLPETSGQDLTQTVLEMDHRIQRRR